MNDIEFRKKLMEYLTNMRESQGISQEEMAEAVEINIHQLDFMERGVVSIDMSYFLRYCKRLGIEFDLTHMMTETSRIKMTGNNYQKLAARTIGAQTDYDKVRHGVFGLCSEAGEVAGLFQKQYQGHEMDPAHLQKELGDCLWMIAEICTANGWNLEDVMKLNIDKLKARYPEGFDTMHSLYRKEGDI